MRQRVDKPTALLERPRRAALTLAAVTVAALLAFASSAQASKQAIDFFGGFGTEGGQFGFARGGVAVSETGAGAGNPGDIYVADASNNRIERFGRDDNGTPGNTAEATADDTYFFISAWGADVVQNAGAGDVGDEAAKDYEICTVASQCKAGVASAGNGTVAGDGSLHNDREGSQLLNGPIALDEDTGELYVTDVTNNRVNVYAGDGAFLRSFGYDVIASGPDNAGTGYEVCIAASGDVCKAGLRGSGAGQIGTFDRSSEEHFSGAGGIAVSAPDGNAASGTVFLADGGNRRVDTYNLDGSSPSSFGSGQFPQVILTNSAEPNAIAVDSRGIVYLGLGDALLAGNGDPRIERYDSQNANGAGVGFLAPIRSPAKEVQVLLEEATAGQFRLSFGGKTTTDLPYNATLEQIRTALEALSSIGPGNVGVNGSVSEIIIDFRGALADTDVEQLVLSNGSTPLTGSIPVTTAFNGHPGLAPRNLVGALAVDPDTDGPGPDADVLYAERSEGGASFSGGIQQFGPANPAGLSAPPAATDDTHNANGTFTSAEGLAIEPATGRLYARAGSGVYVVDETGPPPTASLDSCDNATAKSADCHATIDPNGPPATRYHFEYAEDAAYQVNGFKGAASTPEVLLGAQETPQAVDTHLEPAPIGLKPNTTYHVRVVAGRKFADPVISNELEFTTNPAPPLAETAGAPVRTTTTAQLNGRVTPLNSATSYHFEYGPDESYGQSTLSMPAGSGELTELVGEEIEGLTPDTTYHYRLVASNGVGSPVTGADMTVRTRASNELPGQDDKFPGPPGSDRAWEQVSLAESSGNPVGISQAFSDNGDRAAYGILGGTSLSSTGNLFSLYFAQRPAGEHPTSGWRTTLLLPPRELLAGSKWVGLFGPDDLSTMLSLNSGIDSGTEESEIWRLSPGSSPALLERASKSRFPSETPFGVSADGSRLVGILDGSGIDPAHPVSTGINLYDIATGSPQLLSLLPGGVVPPCGIVQSTVLGFPGSNWVSDDGSLVYFASWASGPCSEGHGPPGSSRLYLREIDAGQTKLISGPPLSGPTCGAGLIKATSGAAFFTTDSRLDPADGTPASCEGANSDVYRYELSDGSLKCVTCVIPGFSVDVEGGGPDRVAVSDDGSRVYFTTQKRLLPGAQPDGQSGIYRVNAQSGSLAYVAQTALGVVGTRRTDVELSPDGKTLAFSSSSTALNPLGGTSNNAGTTQYYRYSDEDRSLICYSCPQDGAAPLGQLENYLYDPSGSIGQSNRGSLSADGQTIAFSTPTPMVGADQNTPGPGGDLSTAIDVYEWRDGRLVLVSDGLTNWTGAFVAPSVQGITPSGRDIFFTATARYTPDAPDALRRLYDARIGGGIDFPKAPPPCPLEVCQGIPKGAPEEQEPASANFRGLGNPQQGPKFGRCPKGKHKVKSRGKVRCVKPGKHRAAKHNRRAHR